MLKAANLDRKTTELSNKTLFRDKEPKLPSVTDRSGIYKSVAEQILTDRPASKLSDNEQFNNHSGRLDGKVIQVSFSHAKEHKCQVYINGMLTEYDKARGDAKELFSGSQANGYLIYNGTNGFLKDTMRAVSGRISSNLGSKAEPAVAATAEFIKSKFKSGDEIIVHAHSQGCIILQNALEILRDELSTHDWQKLAERLTIKLYGTPTYNFPRHIKVTSYEHTGDVVTALAGFRSEENDKNFQKSQVDMFKHDISGRRGYIELGKDDVIHQSKYHSLFEFIGSAVDMTKSVCGTAYNKTKEVCVGAYGATQRGITRGIKFFTDLAA